MFRAMRRKKQLLSKEATEEILRSGQAGVLGVLGDDEYPYTVPLSYVYEDGKIYFHCAKTGHKLDGIRKNSKVSFCVIGQDRIVPEKFTTYFRSAIAFGNARILMDDVAVRHAMELLVRKYSADYQEEGAKEIEREWKALCVVEVSIDHMTGKEAIELVKMK